MRIGILSNSPDRAPNLRNSTNKVRENRLESLESEAGGESDSKRLGIAGLGVELGVNDGKAGVGGVELARGVDEELVLLSSAGGDDSEERRLEILNHLHARLSGVEPLGFVVRYQLLRARQLSFLALALREGFWGSWLLH